MRTMIAKPAQLYTIINRLASASLSNKKRILYRRHIARNRLSFRIEKNTIVSIPLKIINNTNINYSKNQIYSIGL